MSDVVFLGTGTNHDPRRYVVDNATESDRLLGEDNGKVLKFKSSTDRISWLRILSQSRIIIRIFAVVAALMSFILITYSVVLFENAQEAGIIKDSNGAPLQVDVKPAITFSGIGGASFFLSLLLLFVCCGSKKVRSCSDWLVPTFDFSCR